VRQKQETERQHPEPEKRKEAGDATEDEDDTQRNSNPARTGLSHPANDPSRPLRQPPFEAFQMLVQIALAFAVHPPISTQAGVRFRRHQDNVLIGWRFDYPR
jgi:hypothetical protein